MTAPWNTPPGRGHTAGRGRPTGQAMRVSDAERSEVADRLGKHYGDGRLDEAEFNERLDRAMKAKTWADLDGLLDDLPESQPAGGGPAATGTQAPAVPRGRPLLPRLLVVAAVIMIAAGMGHALAWFTFPWLLVLIVALIWLRGPSRRHRYRSRW